MTWRKRRRERKKDDRGCTRSAMQHEVAAGDMGVAEDIEKEEEKKKKKKKMRRRDD